MAVKGGGRCGVPGGQPGVQRLGGGRGGCRPTLLHAAVCGGVVGWIVARALHEHGPELCAQQGEDERDDARVVAGVQLAVIAERHRDRMHRNTLRRKLGREREQVATHTPLISGERLLAGGAQVAASRIEGLLVAAAVDGDFRVSLIALGLDVPAS